MLLRTHLLNLLAATALAAFALAAHADIYTYTYTGNGFTQIEAVPGGLLPNIYTTSDSVSGYFSVLTPLADNLVDAVIYDVSTLPIGARPAISNPFSFTDGLITYNYATSGFQGDERIEVSTDSTGRIIQWYVVIGLPSAFNSLSTINLASRVEDQAAEEPIYGDINVAENTNDPGTWTESINGVPVSNSPVPEPSTFILLATGILGLAAATIRRLPTT